MYRTRGCWLYYGKQRPIRSSFLGTDHERHHPYQGIITRITLILLLLFRDLIVPSLLSDYACYVMPNTQRSVLGAHKANVKCVEFVGEEGNLIASGSSDNTVRLWSTEESRCTNVLLGHTSRVWSLAASRTGNFLFTASGDATACVCNIVVCLFRNL